MHWTGGAHVPSDFDKKPYHFIVDGWGKVHRGVHPIQHNAAPIDPRNYAAHTWNLNTDSISVSCAAMLGAKEWPFHAGRYPLTDAQMDGLAAMVAKLAIRYSIPVTRKTILSHAEVQRTLGVKQKAKWDITWLPGMTAVGDALEVGDHLRARIRKLVKPPKRRWWHRFMR